MATKTENIARIQFETADAEGNKKPLTHEQIIAQFGNENARKLYQAAYEADPNFEVPLSKWGRRKALGLEFQFRRNGNKVRIVRPLLAKLVGAMDEEGSLRIDALLVPVPNGSVKKWVEKGYVQRVEDDGKVYLKFTEAGVEAAAEVE